MTPGAGTAQNGAALRWAVYAVVRRPARGDARRSAIYDARRRNGTTRPRHCVGRCTRWCRQIAISRRSSGRHKCRPYVAGCSSAESRRTDGAGRWCRRHCGATTRDDARRGAIYDARCRNGTTRSWHCVGRCARWCRKIAILRRTDRATQVSPLRCGVFVHDIAADRPGDTSVAPTLRGARSRHCGRPWLSTVDDFYDGDGLDKLTFRYVTVRSNLDGAFSIRYVDVLTVIIRGRFIGQQKYNCPDRRHDHS